MIVGVHGLTDEMPRLHEYSPGFDPQRFAAHEKFFVADVRRWTESRFGVALPAERTAVFGYSAGGELALALGLRHPDIYGAVFSGSPGAGYKPPARCPLRSRASTSSPAQEPFFLDNATQWAAALRDAGADVVMHEREGRTGPSCGEQSSRSWWPGPSARPRERHANREPSSNLSDRQALFVAPG